MRLPRHERVAVVYVIKVRIIDNERGRLLQQFESLSFAAIATSRHSGCL